MPIEPIENYLYRIDKQRREVGVEPLTDAQIEGLYRMFLSARNGQFPQEGQPTGAGILPGSQLGLN